MDMVFKRTAISAFLAQLLLLPQTGGAAEVEFIPFVGTSLVFTDNVDQASSDRRNSLISTIDAGLSADITGNDGNLLFNYELSQLFYSHDSSENSAYQELTFNADKGLWDSGFRVDADASISNLARAIDENANADIFSGDTIESKSAEVGLNYQSNPLSSINFYGRVFTAVANYEDDIGNYDRYGGEFNFENGQRVRDIFWDIEGSYDYKNGHKGAPNTELKILREVIGLQTIHHWSPLIRLNYEDYNGVSEADSTDALSWGPGLRYYWTKTSYLELSYNFSETDGISDFWAGSIHLNPSPRTEFFVSYDKRFFGDAYEVFFSHQTRRLTNAISYTEEATSFDRDTFTSGSDIAEFILSRKLEWTTTLEARRTDYVLTLFYNQQRPLNDNSEEKDEDGYGISMDITHELSRRLNARIGLSYEDYRFRNQAEPEQKDEYWTVAFDTNYELSKNMFGSVGYEFNQRSSSITDNEYDENRIYLEVRVEF